MSKKYTEEEIRVIAQSSLGKTFGELAKIREDEEIEKEKEDIQKATEAYFQKK